MTTTVSSMPDRLLGFTQCLPWPANRVTFSLLRDFFRARGYAKTRLTRIRFGSVEIIAPLDHPSLHWRYQPAGFNRNYTFVAKRILQRRTGLIIDVGANIGDGVALLRGEGISAPVLAIEGAEVWFELLQSNTREIPDVIVERAFLGAQEHKGDLSLNVKDGTSKLVKGKSSIELTTLDSLISHHTQYPVILIKTDTDGFDAQVLMGASSLLRDQKPVIFCEVDEGLLRDQGNSAQDLLGYLRSCGYSRFTAWDNFGRWLASRAIDDGLDDLIETHPGGIDAKPYLDIAVVTDGDIDLLD